MRRAAACIVAALALLPALAAPAHGQTGASRPRDPNALTRPPRLDVVPAGHRLTGVQAERIADRVPKVRATRRHHPGSTRDAFLKGAARWQVSYYSRDGKEIAQVLVDDATGAVLEAWTGYQVAWTMARGYPGAFGRKVNALWVWIPLCVLFVAPFVDPRRPWRLRHLDLLVLVGLSVSLAFFNRANIGMSVPLVYPVLGYLLVRMLAIGFGRGGRGRREPLIPLVPSSWLAIGVIFLVGFRIGLDLVNSNVVDVGYSGVIGGHKLLHGEPLYGHFPSDDAQGDTYGPVAYLAYAPFVAIFGFSGRWDDLPAAHAAAVVFDVLTLLGLWWLGRRLGGRRLALALAWAWVTYPFTLLVLCTNSDDGLVALLVVVALLVASSPAARGAAVALGGMAKFGPLGLLGLFARGPDEVRPRAPALLRYGSAFALTTAVVLVPVLLGNSPREFYDRTFGFQASRPAPFSVWGLYGWDGPQRAVQVAAVLLALALAVVPRRRGLVEMAALSAAVLIALQLAATYWFYLYTAWFFGPAMLALLAGGGSPARPAPPVPAAEAPVPSRRPAAREPAGARLPSPAWGPARPRSALP